MANHKSAFKRARQNEIKRVRNMGYKARVKKAVRKVRAEVADNAADQSKESLRHAVSIIQETASKGIIPRKTASRKISRLNRLVNQNLSS